MDTFCRWRNELYKEDDAIKYWDHDNLGLEKAFHFFNCVHLILGHKAVLGDFSSQTLGNWSQFSETCNQMGSRDHPNKRKSHTFLISHIP